MIEAGAGHGRTVLTPYPPVPNDTTSNVAVTDAVTSPPPARTAVPGDGLVRPESARDRNGYWFPMLLLGFLILLAHLVYQPSGAPGPEYVWNAPPSASTHISGIVFAPLQQFGTVDGESGDPMSVALYWFCVAMFGPLISLLWYHRRARRRGDTPQTGWHLLYASTTLALFVVVFPVIEAIVLSLSSGAATALSPAATRTVNCLAVGGFVAGLGVAAAAAWPARSGRRVSVRRWTVGGLGVLLAIACCATIEFVAYLQPRTSYGALLIIAIGLLALSIVEPGRACVTVAVLFTGSALLANLVGLPTVLHWLGFQVGPWSAVGTAFGNLLLPALVLLGGGLTGMAGVLSAHCRPVRAGR
jgi:hypothetical protein